MENASKALIIAGAILLSILLISLGIMVYNNSRKTIDDANLDSEQVQAFNTKISQYCGTRKSASDMNGLVTAITAANGSMNRTGVTDKHYVNIALSGDSTNRYHTGTNVTVTPPSSSGSNATITGTYPTFSNGTTFDASYTTDANGWINLVTITIK